MRNRWSHSEAEELVGRYAEAGIGADLALRVYGARLLGSDPRLVLHGGGNASVKMRLPDLFGEATEVLCIKGSGADMAVIEPAGFPAVRLDPLRRLRHRDSLADDDLVRLLRASLIDPAAPNPSVETLLHVFLPHRYVDHTHASAVLSLADQPDAAQRCADAFGPIAGIVPYVMSGLPLAKAAAAVFDANPAIEALILLKHGVFTFGEDPAQAYERMIGIVSRAEECVARGRKSVFAAATLPEAAPVAQVAPILRGACALPDPEIAGAYTRFVLDFRGDADVLAYVNGAGLARYGRAGVATPDHAIRTKGVPLIAPAAEAGNLAGFAAGLRDAVDRFAADYRAYFARHNAALATPKRELDPMPRVILVPGLGLFGLGRNRGEARIAADIAQATVETVTGAEAIGRFESIAEPDLFDIEYWSLEQAKLGRGEQRPLAGQVAVVTGGGGTIGQAVGRALHGAGAELALLDADPAAVERAVSAIGGEVLGLGCNVTDSAAVAAAFDAIARHFGGVDILVSNAGAAWQGRIGEVSDSDLRASFELNFFAHQSVAQAAVRIMLAQGTGGCLLFNVSKQAVNPGPNFGPYGLPKAATLFLVRQYALDYGSAGIRANAVNADRIRSGLLTPDMIAVRSKARGLSEHDYMAGNLLAREVTADDVAQAFLHHALALKTTADVTTVDGGNIAAILR
jgi:rhamnose utilization protein RhaD (predicted bifunctional aldolase and dehydrogenase)/NAD(P)-dependent dehydrogenase (short-subunit alcohol dehydrogenase family)